MAVLGVVALLAIVATRWLGEKPWASPVVVLSGFIFTTAAMGWSAFGNPIVANSSTNDAGYVITFVCGIVMLFGGIAGTAIRSRDSRSQTDSPELRLGERVAGR